MKKCPALCTNVCHMEINSSGLGRIHLKIDIILKIKEDSDVGLRPEAISLPATCSPLTGSEKPLHRPTSPGFSSAQEPGVDLSISPDCCFLAPKFSSIHKA